MKLVLMKSVSGCLAVFVLGAALAATSDYVLADESSRYEGLEGALEYSMPSGAADKNLAAKQQPQVGKPAPWRVGRVDRKSCRSTPVFGNYYLGCFVEVGVTTTFYFPEELSLQGCEAFCRNPVKN